MWIMLPSQISNSMLTWLYPNHSVVQPWSTMISHDQPPWMQLLLLQPWFYPQWCCISASFDPSKALRNFRGAPAPWKSFPAMAENCWRPSERSHLSVASHDGWGNSRIKFWRFMWFNDYWRFHSEWMDMICALMMSIYNDSYRYKWLYNFI